MQNESLLIKVSILDQDVTDKSFDVGGITSQLDYPRLTEFRVGEATFSLNDPKGDFSPSNPNNFFTRQPRDVDNPEGPKYHQTGYRASVKIEAGFDEDNLEVQFIGEIIKIRRGVKPKTVKIECVDKMSRYGDSEIRDFGIERHFRLSRVPETSSRNGEYQILKAATPIVNGSVTVYKARDTPMTQVDELATEGDLDPNNYIVSDDMIITEGGFPTQDDHGVAVNYPQIKMKSPYKGILIEDAVTKLIEHLNGELDFEAVDTNLLNHFSSNGRVGYDLIGDGTITRTGSVDWVGSGHHLTWQGFVTDAIFEPAQNSGDYDKFFFLYNSPQTSTVRSVIIEKNEETEHYRVVYRAEEDFLQFWSLSKDDDKFYLLSTTAHIEGGAINSPYDSLGADNKNSIIVWDRSDNSTTLLDTGDFKPQIAQFYQLGSGDYEGGIGNELDTNKILPESRKGFIADDSGVYYTFVNRLTMKFGVIKTGSSSPIVQMDIDGRNNHCGANFSVKGDEISGALTCRENQKSRSIAFRKNI